MKTRSKLLVILFLFVATLAGVLGWVGYRSFKTGFSAKAEPHALEVLLARQIRRLAIPIEQRHAPNPVPPSPEALAEARAHFADHCATCHANDGSGKTPIGQNVYPKAPDLRLKETQSLSDGELFFIIHNGIRFTAMPAWGSGDPDKDLDSWKLVHFIRHLPDLTPEELQEMKALNPKTKKELEQEAAFDRFLEGEDAPAPASSHRH
ncbi:MAG TPA: c-type cytochrome [Nitrospiraceae bacterium]|jgi:mono/diheme cytochrome c family protein|nr:c-type cytochrome [Nitrospiraceae bacterium]